jgi:hypothetical protein
MRPLICVCLVAATSAFPVRSADRKQLEQKKDTPSMVQRFLRGVSQVAPSVNLGRHPLFGNFGSECAIDYGDTIELDFDNDDDSLVESPGACVAVTGIYWQNIKVSSDASCVRISVGESDRRVEDIDARSRVSADP